MVGIGIFARVNLQVKLASVMRRASDEILFSEWFRPEDGTRRYCSLAVCKLDVGCRCAKGIVSLRNNRPLPLRIEMGTVA